MAADVACEAVIKPRSTCTAYFTLSSMLCYEGCIMCQAESGLRQPAQTTACSIVLSQPVAALCLPFSSKGMGIMLPFMSPCRPMHKGSDGQMSLWSSSQVTNGQMTLSGLRQVQLHQSAGQTSRGMQHQMGIQRPWQIC